MTTRYEMFWDCEQCGTKKLLGITHRNCPNCGDAQDETTRYFPKEGEEIEVKNHEYVGADWDCQYCSTPNSQKNIHCIGCGAGKDGTKKIVEHKEVKKVIASNPNTNPNISTINTSSYLNSSSMNTSSNSYQISDPKSNHNYIIGAMIFFAVLIISIFSYLAIVKEDKSVQVIGKDWEREYVFYRYKSVKDTEWCSSMPSDAYNITSRKEERSKKKVPNGESCQTQNVSLGDGSFKKETTCTTLYKEVPVYDKKCSFSIDRWKYDHAMKEVGDLEKNPKWPNINTMNLSSVNLLNNVKLNNKSESYNLILENNDDKKKRWSCNLSEANWNKFKAGQQIKVKVNLLNMVDCDSLFLN